MGNVMTQIDKANGYIYGKAEDDAMRQMYSAGAGFEWDKIATVREKYVLFYFLFASFTCFLKFYYETLCSSRIQAILVNFYLFFSYTNAQSIHFMFLEHFLNLLKPLL